MSPRGRKAKVKRVLRVEEMSRAQLEAHIALSGESIRIVDEVPQVRRGCICPNQGKPDLQGFIVSSPSCSIHGLRTRFLPQSRLTQGSARTVGVIHSRRGE